MISAPHLLAGLLAATLAHASAVAAPPSDGTMSIGLPGLLCETYAMYVPSGVQAGES